MQTCSLTVFLPSSTLAQAYREPPWQAFLPIRVDTPLVHYRLLYLPGRLYPATWRLGVTGVLRTLQKQLIPVAIVHIGNTKYNFCFIRTLH